MKIGGFIPMGPIRTVVAVDFFGREVLGSIQDNQQIVPIGTVSLQLPAFFQKGGDFRKHPKRCSGSRGSSKLRIWLSLGRSFSPNKLLALLCPDWRCMFS